MIPPDPDGAAEPAAASPPPLPVETVAVVGLGLMGGSLARALAALSPAPRVVAMTSDAADAEAATAAGVVDAVVGEPEELAGAGLVVYAIPLTALLDVLPGHAPFLGDTLVTDVSSLKAPVVEAMNRQGLAERYVGSHPMAGGEGSGFGASRPTLYRGATILVTTDTGSPEAHRTVETFWRALGARTRKVEARAHDQRMVWASHLPQLVSNALARVLDTRGVEPEELGPGGRDMTRLAASSPAMWRDLVAHSSELDAAALRAVAGELGALASALEEGRLPEVEQLMAATRQWRRGGRSG